MPSYLCLSVTFLDPAFHGRRDGGDPEWPPSPLRLFQALVAAAAARWGERERLGYAVPALRWLERQPPPLIVAPATAPGAAYRLSVPNNAMDIVGRAWSRGNTSGTGDTNPATHRAMKTVRPTRLPRDESFPAVHFLWDLSGEAATELGSHRETLFAAARSLVALGWGVDLVAGHGRVLSEAEANALPGERWRPRCAAAPRPAPPRGRPGPRSAARTGWPRGRRRRSGGPPARASPGPAPGSCTGSSRPRFRPPHQTCFAWACSGLMYRGVPSRSPDAVSPGSVATWARPKSATHRCPRPSISRLAGFTSRWTIPSPWACSKASAACAARR
jgi:CRISPR-associated protein Csb2